MRYTGSKRQHAERFRAKSLDELRELHRNLPESGCGWRTANYRVALERVIAEKSATPLYAHDCAECVYLGHYMSNDLYVCPNEPTVIARHGDEPSDYYSGLSFVGAVPTLTEAFERADARGLITAKARVLVPIPNRCQVCGAIDCRLPHPRFRPTGV